METRKLQEVGGGTYTVSIPKQWANEQRLEAGKTVHLYTHIDGSVVLRSSERDGGVLRSTRIHIDGDGPELVKRALRAAHAIGFESVTLVPVEVFTDEQRRAARSMVKDLVGVEVLDERDDEITVRHLLDASDVSVRQSVVQLQFIALSIHRRAADAFLDGRSGEYAYLRERKGEVDRLTEMVARHFNRSLISRRELDRLGITRPELFDYYATARLLGRVANEGVAIARIAERASETPSDELADDVRSLADAAGRVVDDAATAALKETRIEEVHEALDARDETLAAIDALDRTLLDESTAEACATARVLAGLRRTAELGGEIAEIVLGADARP